VRAKRRNRRWGLILALGVGLLAIGAIALMVVRPARVVGVTKDSIGSSIRHEADATGSRCESVPGGRPDETAWRCRVVALTDGGSSSITTEYALQATEWGCWEGQRIASRGGQSPRELSSCIWLADHVFN
jgi:hypothetical protein